MNNVFLLSLVGGLLFSSAAVHAGTFDDFPDEIHMLIASKLPPKDLASLSEVSRHYEVIANDEALWAAQFSPNMRALANEFKNVAQQTELNFSYKTFFRDNAIDPILFIFISRIKKAGFDIQFEYTVVDDSVMSDLNDVYKIGETSLALIKPTFIANIDDEIHILRRSNFTEGHPQGVGNFAYVSDLDISEEDKEGEMIQINGYTQKQLPLPEDSAQPQDYFVPPFSKIEFNCTENGDNLDQDETIYEDFLRK